MNPVEIKWETRAAASCGWLFVHHSLTLPHPKGFSSEQTDSAVLTDFYWVQGVHNLLARVTAIQRSKLCIIKILKGNQHPCLHPVLYTVKNNKLLGLFLNWFWVFPLPGLRICLVLNQPLSTCGGTPECSLSKYWSGFQGLPGDLGPMR